MSSGGSSGTGGSKGLLLRRCDVEFGDEVYVARGLSIGRAPDNVFVIEHGAVSRHHCQVEWDGAGGLILRCVDPGAVLEHQGRPVTELKLTAGLRLRVGPAEFECRSAGRTDAGKARWVGQCPYCHTTNLPPPGQEVQPCPECGRGIIVFRLRQSSQAVCVAGESGSVRLVRLVGEGGMSVVFEGRVVKTGAPVAVKLLHPQWLEDADAVRRFEREVSELRKLDHPRLVKIVGQGKWGGYPALLTEWLPGGSLTQVMERRPRRGVEFAQALVWLRQACEGLEVLHGAGLVHRDIKPSNLLLTANGEMKIADLGLARRMGHQTSALTATGLAVGSPRYMAPEQWERPDAVDGRTDIYALGVTFYELLTGRVPVGAWVPASQMNRTIPAAFDGVLARMLAPLAEERFADVGQLRKALEQVSPSVPPPLPHARGWEGKGVRLWVLDASVLAVAVIVCTLLAMVLSRCGPPSPGRPPPRPKGTGTFVATQGRHAVFSPDGRRIVTTPLDYTAIVWDADTGDKLQVLRGHTGTVVCAAFSPDGRRIVTASWDQTAIVWDADTGKKRQVLRGHTDLVISAAFSPDGRRIVTASVDKTAIVWDADTGERLQVLRAHSDWVRSGAFSPDGRRIVTASDDGTAIVWDADTGEKRQVLRGHNRWARSAAFGPDGQRVVTTSWDKTAIVWDADTGEKRQVLRGHTDRVSSASLSPDGRRIVTASADGTAIVWDADTGEKLQMLQGHTHSVVSAAFSPDGRRILTASWDGTAIVWDANSGRKLRVLNPPE